MDIYFKDGVLMKKSEKYLNFIEVRKAFERSALSYGQMPEDIQPWYTTESVMA